VNILAGPVAFIVDALSLIFLLKFSIYGILLRALKIFTWHPIKIIINEISLIIPKIMKLLAMIFACFYIFTYCATFLYQD